MYNKFVFLLTLCVSIIVTPVYAKELTCGSDLSFMMPGQIKEKSQNIALSESMSIDISQYISSKNVDGNKIVVNVVCQSLTGKKYTGSAEEWKHFFDAAINGFTKAKFKEISLTLVGEDDVIVQNNTRSKEYIFTGTKGANKQYIKNLAVLSKDMHSVLTLSVSGNTAIEKEVNNLFRNLAIYVDKKNKGELDLSSS